MLAGCSSATVVVGDHAGRCFAVAFVARAVVNQRHVNSRGNL
jgi:hypothetical protein